MSHIPLWILTVADAEYPEHIEDTEYFDSHSKAVERAKEILLESLEEKQAIEEFVASIKDGESVDKIIGEIKIEIKPIILLDYDGSAVDLKSIWMASIVGTNYETEDDIQYFAQRANAAAAAEHLLKEAFKDFKEYVEDDDVAAEVEKFKKTFSSTAADESVMYNDELLDELSICVEKIKLST